MAVKVVQLMMKPFVKGFKVGAISSRLPLASVDLIELQQLHSIYYNFLVCLFTITLLFLKLFPKLSGLSMCRL